MGNGATNLTLLGVERQLTLDVADVEGSDPFDLPACAGLREWPSSAGSSSPLIRNLGQRW
jgi:hypothetical protein